MNSDILNLLSSYQSQIDSYKKRLSPDHPATVEVQTFLDDLMILGETFNDVGSFMTHITADDSMNKMTSLLTAQAMAALDEEREKGKMKIASVADYALAFHESYKAITDIENMPLTKAVYDQIFALEKQCSDAAQMSALMAVRGLSVKVATVALEEESQKHIKEAEELSLPSAAYHEEQMVKMAQQATSALEVEVETQVLMELHAIELASDQILMQDLILGIYGAVVDFIFIPSEENRAAVESNVRFAADFFGLLWMDIYQLPRVKDYIDKAILRELKIQHPEITLNSNISEHMGIIDKCLEGKDPVKKGDSSRQNFLLWAKSYSLEQAQEVYRHPIRPE